LLAHLANAIYGLLKAELFMCHENVGQVMRLAARLFDIVREYILKRYFVLVHGCRWEVVPLTFDHDTRSLAL
jgi:hypothetical protein